MTSRATLLWMLLSVASVVALASVFGTPLRDTTLYLGYLLAYVLLPGACCYLLVATTTRTLLTILLHGWVVGQLLEIWAYVFLLAVGHERLFPYYPVVILLLGVWNRRAMVSRWSASWRTASTEPEWRSAIGLCLVSLCAVFPALLYHFRPPIDQHFTWVAAYANSARNGWPLEEPFLLGIPLNYHYLPNMHVAATSFVTGIPVLVLSARLLVIVHLWLALAIVFHFAKARFGSWAVGILASVQILSTYGYSPIGWNLFHHATASILVLLPSTLLAFEILAMIWYETGDYVLRPERHRGLFLLISIVLFASSGIRAQLLPVVLAGLCVSGAYVVRARRPVLGRLLPLMAVAFAALIFGLWFFYGLGTTTDATAVIRLGPFSHTAVLVSSGMPSWFYQSMALAAGSEKVAAACSIAIALVGRLGFLLPGVIAYFVWFRREEETVTVAMLGGGYLAGVGAVIFLESPFQEQWNFQLYGDLAIAIVGAAGFVRSVASRASPALALLLLGLPGLAVSSCEFFPPLLEDVRRTAWPMECLSYSDEPELQGVVRRLQKELPSRSVIVTGGELGAFDDRILPVLVPGVQLLANRKQLAIYLKRVNPDPHLLRRKDLLAERWKADTYLSIRNEVPRDRGLFLFWLGPAPPPGGAGLHSVFAEGRYSVYSIGPDAEGSGRPRLLDSR
jgi:hypothetical protein